MRAVFETRFAKVGETSEHYNATKISSSQDAKDFVRDSLGEYFADKLDQEEFLVILLDTKRQVRRVVRITRGTLDSTLIHPREIFRPAVAEAASAIILVHNHPSGDPEPSQADISSTARLAEAGKILGVDVLDHIISGEGVAISLKERGLM